MGYTLQELELLHSYGYIKKPLVRLSITWYDGYTLVAYPDDSYTKMLLSDIDISVSDEELILFLRKYNIQSKKNKEFTDSICSISEPFTLPLRTEYGFTVPNNIKKDYSMCTLKSFKYNSDVMSLLCRTFEDKLVEVTFLYNYALIEGLSVNYPEVKDLMEDFTVDYTMRKLAGVHVEKPYKDDIIHKDIVVREDVVVNRAMVNIITSLGLVRVATYNRLSIERMLNNMDSFQIIKRHPNEPVPIMNIAAVRPLQFHSMTVIDGVVKIWVVCIIRINKATPLIGRLPLKYCIISMQEGDYSLECRVDEGSITVSYPMFKHLDSSFTIDEMLDVYPEHKDVLKLALSDSIEEGTL